MAADEVSDGGRATVKQVYDAVGETRKELGDKIDGLADHLDAVVVAHEHRLTAQESKTTEHEGRLSSVESLLGTLRDEHNVARGHVRAYAVIGGVLATLLAGGLAEALVAAVH